MQEAIIKLKELLDRLDKAKDWDNGVLIDVDNKLKLYLKKFFPKRRDYVETLDEINTEPEQDWKYSESLTKLKSLITTLLEDIQLSGEDISIMTERERQSILEQARQESEILKDRMEMSAREVQKLREELQNERQRILAEEEKYNLFKTKLEIADKELDFQFQAQSNKKNAIVWVAIASLLIAFLLFILFKSLDTTNNFSTIANNVKLDFKAVDGKIDTLTMNTIYFTYSKFIFTKLLLYSLLIYAIIFCVKNYNAQMHNQVVNTHKSNAFKSTLSLLNTARSDDGNDKLLIQATQAIFAHQQSGYSGKDSEPPSPNLVTNVIDAASKKI